MKRHWNPLAALCALSLCLAAGYARAIGSESHGGIGIAIDDRLYLLDLAEAGIERSPGVEWGKDREPLASYGLQPIPIELVQADGKRETRFVADFTQFSTFIGKSAAHNGYLFGRAVPEVCGDCYTAAAEIAVALANQLATRGYQSATPGDSVLSDLVRHAVLALDWVVVHAPLVRTSDETSPFPGNLKFMLASRRGNTVSLSAAGWSEPASVDGRQLLPLDRENRLALLTHELFYAITEQQGDRNSDRAREINSRLWTAYAAAYQNLPHFEPTLVDVPGTPSEHPVFASELPPGTVLEFTRDYTIPASSFLALVAGHEPMDDNTYHIHFYPFTEGSAELFNANNLWLQPTPIRQGTRMPIVGTWVNVANTDRVTRIQVGHQWGSPVDRIDVYTPRAGTPALLSDFEAMIAGTLRIVGSNR
jgi:hypothetical protein